MCSFFFHFIFIDSDIDPFKCRRERRERNTEKNSGVKRWGGYWLDRIEYRRRRRGKWEEGTKGKERKQQISWVQSIHFSHVYVCLCVCVNQCLSVRLLMLLFCFGRSFGDPPLVLLLFASFLVHLFRLLCFFSVIFTDFLKVCLPCYTSPSLWLH